MRAAGAAVTAAWRKAAAMVAVIALDALG